LSFSAQELAANVAQHVEGFICTFTPDERQKIADSWPKTIDDAAARTDWGWQPAFNLEQISQDMLQNLSKKLARS
jgi:nucleoside-diphosphate-sugar epimerase